MILSTFPCSRTAGSDFGVRYLNLGGRYLRVVLLPDNETVHNAFFDNGFRP